MKKINSIILAACVAALGFFSSCNKDKESESQPKITVDGASTLEKKVGEEVTFAYNVKKDIADLTSFTVTLNQEGVDLTETLISIDANSKGTPTLKDLNKAGGYDFTFTKTFTSKGKKTVTLTAKDKDGGETVKTVTITVIEDVTTPTIEYKHTKISVVAGKTYGFKNGTLVGEMTIVSVETNKVVLTIKGVSGEFTLSKAGTSYLGKDYKTMLQAAAKADPANVLMCLLSDTADVASATLASDATIKNGATETKFSDALN